MIDHVNGEKKKSGLFGVIRTAALLKRPKTPVTAMIPGSVPGIRKPLPKERSSGRILTFFSSQPGITVSGPIFKANGQLQSIVEVDIEIDDSSFFISRLRIGKHGRAFMLNNNGHVVAFPDISKINRAKVLQPTTSEWLKSMNWTIK
ncbi:MAG: cache domain-containing protein [Desulfobacterales bacterium]